MQLDLKKMSCAHATEKFKIKTAEFEGTESWVSALLEL